MAPDSSSADRRRRGPRRVGAGARAACPASAPARARRRAASARAARDRPVERQPRSPRCSTPCSSRVVRYCSRNSGLPSVAVEEPVGERSACARRSAPDKSASIATTVEVRELDPPTAGEPSATARRGRAGRVVDEAPRRRRRRGAAAGRRRARRAERSPLSTAPSIQCASSIVRTRATSLRDVLERGGDFRGVLRPALPRGRRRARRRPTSAAALTPTAASLPITGISSRSGGATLPTISRMRLARSARRSRLVRARRTSHERAERVARARLVAEDADELDVAVSLVRRQPLAESL